MKPLAFSLGDPKYQRYTILASVVAFFTLLIKPNFEEKVKQPPTQMIFVFIKLYLKTEFVV